mmetsp:Transcript_18196/g.54682  ORF Transcript_18196/g.54682 Transcript_18196/m.54682 type:complete len:355 (+) Transcript_18196:191-1255(+)
MPHAAVGGKSKAVMGPAGDDLAWISAPIDRCQAPASESGDLPTCWQVPTVDLSQDDAAAAVDFVRAASEVGFAYVTNHGVSNGVLDDQFRESAAFFALPAEEKLKLKADSSNRGYHPPGSGTAKNPYNQADRKEAVNLYLGWETDDVDRPFHGRTKWPSAEAIPGFRPAMTAYYTAMDAVARRLLRLIALGLQLPGSYFDDKFNKSVSNVRALRYLPGAHCARDGIFGVGAHTDWGMLTVLATDTTPGLQVRHRGAWHEVPPKEGAFVVNVGDLLHRWTGGRFKSTLHRVEKRTEGERYSTPFFCAPNWDAVIEVLPGCDTPEAVARFPPISAGAWLLKRRDAEYGDSQTLQVA